MSRETQAWLDTMIKVGFTAPEHGRGDAWHRREGNDNSYPHAVPYDAAYELIAGWQPVRVTPHWHNVDNDEYVPLKDYHGNSPVALIHSENHFYLGTHTERYADHGYKERFFDALEGIFDDSFADGSIGIGSCGLLDGYKKAWVQIEVPDTIEIPGGERIRPFVTATSSLDGSIANTYLRGATRVVCDNTLDMAMFRATHTYKFRSTTNSGLKIANAREALDIVFKVSDEFTQQIDHLLSIKITEKDFGKFLDAYVPVPEEEGRGKTMATNKRNGLTDLYHSDPMVAPWSGTAWGVAQAVNTYAEHLAIVRKASREERNMVNFITGKIGHRDANVIDTLMAAIA